MKFIRFLFLFFLLPFIQSHFAGTVLSSKGTGTPFFFPNTRSMGMGGLSIAYTDPFTISRVNPAGLFTIKTTSLSLQYFYENNKYKDNYSQSATSQYSNLDGFNFVLPFGKNVGFGLGLIPLTRMDYHFAWDNEIQDVSYTKSVEGQGGLNIITASFFWSIHPSISIGISGDYMFGEMEETWRVEYDSLGFLPSNDLFSTKNWGFTFTAGCIVRPIQRLTLGAIYSPDVILKNKTNIYYSFFEDTSLSHEGSLEYPGVLGIGASFLIRQNVNVGIEFVQKDWTILAVNEQTVQGVQKILRFSAGGEIKPSLDESAPYWKKINYRVGYSRQPYFARDPDGNTINEQWFTIGFGLPLIRHQSQIDIALNFGKRGSLKTNGLSENLFRLSLSITGGEKWFIRSYK
jgi:hypothetical protein